MIGRMATLLLGGSVACSPATQTPEIVKRCGDDVTYQQLEIGAGPIEPTQACQPGDLGCEIAHSWLRDLLRLFDETSLQSGTAYRVFVVPPWRGAYMLHVSPTPSGAELRIKQAEHQLICGGAVLWTCQRSMSPAEWARLRTALDYQLSRPENAAAAPPRYVDDTRILIEALSNGRRSVSWSGAMASSEAKQLIASIDRLMHCERAQPR